MLNITSLFDTLFKETKILLLSKYYSISMNHSVIIPDFIPYEKIDW